MITLTLRAPGKNALSSELMVWLTAELEKAGGEPVLITGDGDAFCAGLNLKEVASLDLSGMTCFLETLERMVTVLFDYPGPTVAWINGHAIAGGCVVAMACDHRLMTESPSARIGLNEVPLGLRFPPRTWRLVKHRVAAHAITRVVLAGELHAADSALRLGLIDDIVPDEATARDRAASIAASPAAAYRAAKAALRAGVLDVDVEEQRRFRDEALPEWVTPEAKARIALQLHRGKAR